MPRLTDAEQDKLWRAMYRERRYLKDATVDQVRRRFRGIWQNAYSIGRDGGSRRRDDLRNLELLAHVLEEMSIRRMPLGDPETGTYKNARRAAELWDRIAVEDRSYLLKFGQSRYIVAMHERGTVQVSPATSYNDPSLNAAIHDDELEFTRLLFDAKVHFPPGNDPTVTREQWLPIPVIGSVRHTVKMVSNYYVACFAMRYDYRLFDDFGYDACLVIRDPQWFIDTLQISGHKALPGWQFCSLPVTYSDPFNSPMCLDDIAFTKDISYAYQREFRAVWEPPSEQHGCKPVFLELGPLSDYCDLLTL